MDELFVVGDIYGHYDKSNQLLTEWNPDKQKLVFIGNLIGKGKYSFQTLELARKLQQDYGAVVLGGSQEELFMDWIKKPEHNTLIYYNRGGREVLESFVGESITKQLSPESIVKKIIYDHYEVINFILNLPDHLELDNFLVVPAGVRLNANDWRMSTSKHFRWGHESFQNGKNNTGKTIVFGTIPIQQLHRRYINEGWVSACKSKIGINGSANRGGCCLAVHLENGNYRFIRS